VAGSIFGEVGVALSRQGQHFAKFWEIVGTRNLVFFDTKFSLEWDGNGLESGVCEINDFILELLSNCRR